MSLSKASKMKEIMRNPEAVAMLEGYVPGFSKDARLKMALGMSLEKVAKMVPDMVKAEWIDEIDAKLQAIVVEE